MMCEAWYGARQLLPHSIPRFANEAGRLLITLPASVTVSTSVSTGSYRSHNDMFWIDRFTGDDHELPAFHPARFVGDHG